MVEKVGGDKKKSVLFWPAGSRERALIDLIGRYWRQLFFAMLCMMVVAASTAASAYLVKPMLDDIFVNRDQSRLLIIPGAAILIFFLKGIATYGQQYWMNYVGEQIIKGFRNALYDRIIDLPLSFFHKEKTGVLMSRITNDVNIVKAMVSSAVTNLLRDLFTVIGLTFVIFYMDWKLAIGAFLVLPAAFYPVVVFGRRVRRFSTGCQEAMADLSVFLYETFSGSKVVKIFTMESFEKSRFQEKTETLFRLEMKSVVAKSLSSPVMEFVGGIGIAFIIWFGGARVISGASTTGTFFSFLTAVMMLYDPVKKLTKLNNTVQEGLAAVTRIYDIMERQSEIRETRNPKNLPEGPLGVVLENVSFTYDALTESYTYDEKKSSNAKNFSIVNQHDRSSATPDHGNDVSISTVSGHGSSSVTPDHGNDIPISTVNRHGRILATPDHENDMGVFTVKHPSTWVLKDISLDVQPGEVLALVGMSGGGKTSLVNLIPRFYDVTLGRLLVGGVDVKEMSLQALRSRISIVTQEPILFNETVLENIRYGKSTASEDEVIAAARAAYAHDFIMQFPDGYDTVIGELGSRLSGGEKQRLCIARALIKDAPILILDEATSALDAEAEEIVQKALSNLMKGRTTFVIAHRLSTIQHAHRVVVIKQGKIVEQGTHDQLMAMKGSYFKLQTMQSRGGVIDDVQTDDVSV